DGLVTPIWRRRGVRSAYTASCTIVTWRPSRVGASARIRTGGIWRMFETIEPPAPHCKGGLQSINPKFRRREDATFTGKRIALRRSLFGRRIPQEEEAGRRHARAAGHHDRDHLEANSKFE